MDSIRAALPFAVPVSYYSNKRVVRATRNSLTSDAMFRWKRPIDRELFCCILSSYLGFVSFFLDRQKKKPFAHFSISKTGEVHRADKEIISDRKQEKEKNLERQKKNLVSGFTLC